MATEAADLHAWSCWMSGKTKGAGRKTPTRMQGDDLEMSEQDERAHDRSRPAKGIFSPRMLRYSRVPHDWSGYNFNLPLSSFHAIVIRPRICLVCCIKLNWMPKLYIGREPCPPTKAYLDPNSLVVCYAGEVSTTASPQPLRPGAAGEVFSSMYSCYFFCFLFPVECVRKQTIS
jgi:hypothetical protein